MRDARPGEDRSADSCLVLVPTNTVVAAIVRVPAGYVLDNRATAGMTGSPAAVGVETAGVRGEANAARRALCIGIKVYAAICTVRSVK